MPRQSGITVSNDFKNGLITEASGLNFPENASTETYNCIYNIDGSVKRRKGIDFEINSLGKNINRDGCSVVTYLWKNVAGDGELTLLVMQVGSTIYFYKTTEDSLSTGAVISTITLTPVAGAPTPSIVEAQFSDGNGYLIITHPYCLSMRVSFDVSTEVASASTITLKIRDFEGDSADPYAMDFRPTSTLAGLDDHHEYNLRNQGWTTANLTTWDTTTTTMPSNVDVAWTFKNASDVFDPATTAANIYSGNSAAPRGHFILNLYNQDRDTAAGTTGVAATTSGYQRPSTSAFFAGRVFYAGINYKGFNADIYFTQILERTEQYEMTYQVNDPTAEDLFDLLPSDGGVISIPEAGTIFKLMSVPGGLAVFASNGVWFVMGSTGIGFTANDYTVQKISTVSTISASSFINVSGFPSWWNNEGIYVMAAEGTNTLPTVKSLVYTTLKTFYDEIPQSSKVYAKGFFNHITGTVQWLYRSQGTTQINNIYEYDRILNYNIRTNAFYPWTISDSTVKVNSLVVIDSVFGQTSVADVVDNSGNLVVDGSGNQVIAYTTSGLSDAVLNTKFLVSKPSGATYSFTFAEESSEEYIDWFQNDSVGVNYTSYFITGYRLKGEGIRKWQNGWIQVFSKILNPVSYYIQGIWDYANTGSGTGRWSTKQYVLHDDTKYDFASRKLKIRGQGITLQLKVTSATGEPFHIIGWSCFDNINALP